MSIPPNTESVKSRRYDSPRRRAQAASTRRAILESARQLFEANGYAGTTLAAIAADAQVAVETIYRSFEGKAGLLEEVIVAAVAGSVERAAVPVIERPAIKAIVDEPDAGRKIALHSATQPGIHTRSGPLLRALREAAANDDDLRVVLTRLESQRLEGMNQYAGDLLDTGQVRAELARDEVRDTLWTLTSLEVHDLLVIRRGWSPDGYAKWLSDTLVRTLLSDSGDVARRGGSANHGSD